MSKLRVAVIGSGQVARTSHINHYKSLPDVEVSAVCDVNQDAAKMAANEFLIPSWYTDAGTMLEEVRPDAVSICVPNKFHCEMTCLCLEHGCHVLCEKPFGVDAPECQKAVRKDLNVWVSFPPCGKDRLSEEKDRSR